MKILTLHVDYIKFRPLKKALKSIPEITSTEKKEQEAKEALVVFTAIEHNDSIVESVKELVKNIREIASQVKAENIVLYPYAHLSNNLAAPQIAMEILDKSEKELKKFFRVLKAPFGYYKEFELKVKGHPLSELSREIRAGSIETKDQAKIKGVEKEKDYNPKSLLRALGKSILDRSKLKDYDHRILGQDMDLFSFSDVSPGSVFWHPNGFIIYNELISFMRGIWKAFGYKEISTPQIINNNLWKISGHWEHYKENMFLTEYEGKHAAIKPMNCPPAMLFYRLEPRSYKELPLRLAEFGVVHRKELSGVLAGLFRVVRISMDDAHIFCTREQIEPEIENLFKIVKLVYKDTFNFDYSVELSTRPEKFLGSKEEWDFAEMALESALKKSKVKYKIKKGEGAFYGPKIDIHIKDSLEREWQVATIQLDSQMPQRFELKYIDKDNTEKTPLVIHRAIFGSLERFIGILLEHTKGRLPTWLAPIQVRVLSFTNRNESYAKKVVKLLEEGIPHLRIDFDFRSIPVPSKVRDAEIMKIPYIIVIGDKEEEQETLAVRIKGSKKIKTLRLKEFVESLYNEISKRI
ncbi:MAG: threonine--tRNA ligase [Candidatus Pacearchaeota archaeon]